MNLASFCALFSSQERADAYLNFVLADRDKTGYTELHHIIPRSFFSDNKSNHDSPSNLVRLSFLDHCRAHLLLAEDLKPSNLRMKALKAARFQITAGKAENLGLEDLRLRLMTLTEKVRPWHHHRAVAYLQDAAWLKAQLYNMTVKELASKLEVRYSWLLGAMQDLGITPTPIYELRARRAMIRQDALLSRVGHNLLQELALEKTLAEIATALGEREVDVKAVLKRCGIYLGKGNLKVARRSSTVDRLYCDAAEVASRYIAGEKFMALAMEYDVGISCLKNLLVRQGVYAPVRKKRTVGGVPTVLVPYMPEILDEILTNKPAVIAEKYNVEARMVSKFKFIMKNHQHLETKQ